jgi:hypothetical protein
LKAEKHHLPGIFFHRDLQKFRIILSDDVSSGEEWYLKIVSQQAIVKKKSPQPYVTLLFAFLAWEKRSPFRLTKIGLLIFDCGFQILDY